MTFLFLLFNIVQPNSLYAEQSCCTATMQPGVNNPYVCGIGETTGYIGNCVWWAVYKRPDLNFMTRSPDSATYPNAWVNAALLNGYSVGKTPQQGAIVVYDNVSPWTPLGHVAYVESVNGNQYTVSEMGYDSWNCERTKTRTAGTYNENYIYLKASSGYASVSAQSISPSPVILGQNFNVNFTLKEVNGASKTFDQVAVAILRSDN